MVSYFFVLVVLATIYQGVSLLPFDIEQVQLKTNYPSSPNNKNEAQLNAFYYLMKYGYVNGDSEHENSKSGKLLTTDSIKEAIKKFQEFAGLDATGILDEETTKMMDTPRCGVKDLVGPSDDNGVQFRRRRKRYALQGSRWSLKTLTYRITKYPSTYKMTHKRVDYEIERAFKVWSENTGLKFEVRDSGSVHIEIRFESRSHGDGDPFDGRGGTLAHAFFPIYGGDAHFDDDEHWTYRSYQGTNLFQTAAHEFGHSLGLSHSNVRGALMAPFYQGYSPDMKLHGDDIRAIQQLYGKKEREIFDDTSSTTPDTLLPGGQLGDLCEDKGRIDAIFGTADDSYYAFKGQHYYKLTQEGNVESGYPRFIEADWVGLPNDIDAAFTWPNNRYTYFFKGDKYWRFDSNMGMSKGYPRKIADEWTGIPNNLDAAFVWGLNGKIYFFKGSKYYKFDPESRPPVSTAYPRHISNWDLPSGISSAFVWNNKRTYFFHEDQYYRFNDVRFAVDNSEDEPSYPRPTAKWWFGCEQYDDHLVDHAQSPEENVLTTHFDETFPNSFFDNDFLHVFELGG